MNKRSKQYEVLQGASLFLKKHHCEPMIAEILLRHHLSLTRSQFFARMHEQIPSRIVEQFQAQINQHVQTGIPVQHLTGYETFYGRDFHVDKHVLIPRPETEELVQHVIKQAKENAFKNPVTIVDVGTGSGIIAITLALELQDANVYATDISLEALAVAKQNATKHSANVTFLAGDFLQPVIDSLLDVDIIVSNPPYIAFDEKSQLSRTVAHFDPDVALFAKKNGLYAYESIVQQANKIALNKTELIFEIGHTQGKAVQSIIHSHFPDAFVEITQDMNRKDRIVTATLD